MPDKDNCKLGVFAYNFPHKKTQDFLFRLRAEGLPVKAVFACDPVELAIPPSTVRTKLHHSGLVHPKQICESLNFPYHVVTHNGQEIENLIKKYGLDIGIISGARILKKPTIDAFKFGVMNFHPGLIPRVRGLDSLLWAIYKDLPLGITAHLIDARVDAGRVLLRHRLPLHPDDTLLDLGERLMETQVDLIAPAIEKALADKFEEVKIEEPSNKKMPPELEAETVKKFPDYLRRRLRDEIRAR